ncbi:MAG: helix-turn-helix transcriptional regulator [Coriobacteriia bacterium]|nr:helix-turn-helix transcriptional regulator [Coriobacteriia bacterium]
MGVAGFSLYLTWLFLILVNTLLMNSGIPRDSAVGVIAFFFAGEVVASGFAWALSKRLMSVSGIRIVVVVAAVLTPMCGVSMFLWSADETLLRGIWFLAGFGAVCLLCLWGIFLSQLNHRRAVTYPAVAMFAEVFLLLVVLHFFKVETLKVTMIVLPLLSSALFARWIYRSNLEYIVSCYCITRPPAWKSLLHSSSAMVANGFLLGFVIFAISVTALPSVSVIVLVAMLAAALFKIYDASHQEWFEVSELIKEIAPTAAIGLLLLPIVDQQYRVILLAIMILVATLNEIVCWSAVAQYMHVYQLVPFANMAFGRIGDIVGLALGYFCAYTVLGTSFEGAIRLPILLDIAVIALIFMQAFFFRNSYTPFTEHPVMDHDFPSPKNDSQHAGYWKMKCVGFANYYQLSRRQQEVLVWLAKGHSRASIEKTMFISGHTVKAHIYSIYRKTDVHTRQELIDAIEKFQLDDEEE